MEGLSERLLSLAPERPLAASEARVLVRAADAHGAVSSAAVHRFCLLDGLVTGDVWYPNQAAVMPMVPCDENGVPLSLPAQPDPFMDEGPWVAAIGAFDGLHLGHQALVARAHEEAVRRGAKACAVTFSPDPAEVLVGPREGTELLPLDRRTWGLLGLGVDALVVIDFTPELAALSYESFVRDVLGHLMDLSALVVGSDFRLGVGGAGTVSALSELGARGGFDVLGMDLCSADGAAITATRIRGLVREGRVESAAGLLGRCHQVTGTVEHGRGEGTGFGFPTANVSFSPATCLPQQGVYAGFVTAFAREGATAWPAAINVGMPPTFSPADQESKAFLEATLLGYSGDLYGAEVAVTFVRWLRDSRPFGSVEELERTVLGNVDWVRKTLGDSGVALAGEVGA